MLEGSKAAAQFIDNLIDSKLGETQIEPDVRQTLHQDLLERLETQIIQAILNLLSEHEQRELEHLVDSKQTHKIEEYLANHGINMDQLLAGVMAEFQASYIGA